MKKKQRPEPMVGPSTTSFYFFVSILLNENRTKGENERENIYEQKRKGEEIIVMTASRRRAMKELGRVTFSPDTTSGGGSPLREEGLSREEDTFKYEKKERGKK
jgi:hypothetical protein